MAKPRAFIFDVFGTLVDWRGSMTRHLGAAFQAKGITTDPQDVAVAWRAQYDPSMAPIRAGRRAYVNLDILHSETLLVVLKAFGLRAKFNDAECADLVRGWEKLDPWGDVQDGIQSMRKHGFVAPCSNGSIALMSHLARHAGLEWDCILGAELAQNYKPHCDVYLGSCGALQLDPSDVMMVACHNDDLAAARGFGLQTGFFPRPDEHQNPSPDMLAPSQAWDIVAFDLQDMAAQLGPQTSQSQV